MRVSVETLEAIRQRVAIMTQMGIDTASDAVAITDLVAVGKNGACDVRVRLYKPDSLAAKAPIVLHIHGGGFLFGSAELGEARNCDWAKGH
jgi:acetyl esterase/lipase